MLRKKKSLLKYKSERVLFLSDIHFPYEDSKLLKQILRWIEFNPVHRIVINGDLLDFYELSRFLKSPTRAITAQDEIDLAYDFLVKIRSIHDQTIDFIPGNHELRLEKYLRSDAIQLAGLRCLELPNLLKLRELDINPHDSEGFLLRPNFLVYHGEAVRKHSGHSAKAELEKYGISGISGHTHRMDSYHKTDLTGTRGWYEQGCLCRMDPEYVKSPDWQQGFAVGEFDYNSKWHNIELVSFSNGKLLYRGESYA
jgi:predicted phosphodiesterase